MVRAVGAQGRLPSSFLHRASHLVCELRCQRPGLQACRPGWPLWRRLDDHCGGGDRSANQAQHPHRRVSAQVADHALSKLCPRPTRGACAVLGRATRESAQRMAPISPVPPSMAPISPVPPFFVDRLRQISSSARCAHFTRPARSCACTCSQRSRRDALRRKCSTKPIPAATRSILAQSP